MKRKSFLLIFLLVFILLNPIFAHAWIQVNTDGFGSYNNESIRAMAEYNNSLYAGTRNDPAGCQVWEYYGSQPWTLLTPGWDTTNQMVYSMAEYSGLLYMGTWNHLGTGSEVWTYDGSTSWNQLTPGWDTTNWGASSMTVDNVNNILYVGTYNADAEGAEVWQYNGTSWTQITPTWDADNENARSMVFHDDTLYVGIINTTDGAEVWEYDPAAVPTPTWTQIAVTGFGNSNNTGIYGLVEYNNNIYAGTKNEDTGGAEVWQYNGTIWTEITTTWDATNTIARVMTVFENRLYVGLVNDTEGAQIWTYNGSDWEQKAVDGFGDTNNTSPPSMAEINNLLYVGTTNTGTGTEVWEIGGFTVSAISGDTGEDGTTATFTVSLASQPTDGVTIGVSSSDTTEGTVNYSSLTFTALNWDADQTVTVTGVNDFVIDGNQDYTILLGAATSVDTNYNGRYPDDVAVTNIDDDTADFTVSAISGDTGEDGTTATFTVRLTSEPTADVTTDVSSSDTNEGTVNPTSLTFTDANWNIDQTVTVTGVNDFVIDGNQSYTIILGAATSGDPDYDGLDPDNVAVTNIDDETAGFTVSAISGDTGEDGTQATFTVRLTSEPTADVGIGVSSSDTTEGTVDPLSLIFTALNWNID